MLSKVIQRNFASKIMAGSTNNKKDSAGRRLGIKKWGAAEVRKGDILLKQRGHKWHPGNHVRSTKDHTIHAEMEGIVAWSRDRYSFRRRSRIHVIPQEIPNRKLAPPTPFVYHPELFEALAPYNPEPTTFEIPKKKKVVKTGKKPVLACKAVESPGVDTSFIDVTKCIPTGYLNRSTQFRGHASDRNETQEAIDELSDFQSELNTKVQKHFNYQYRERGVIYQE